VHLLVARTASGSSQWSRRKGSKKCMVGTRIVKSLLHLVFAGKKAVHLLVARTASGSSVRFASAFAAAYQRWCAAASIINTHLHTHLV